MKKTMRFLSMAALALVGAVMTSCSNKDDAIVEPQQPGNNVVTLKTTVSMNAGGTTRALDGSGHKTFAVGETMALIYKNTSGTTVKAVSAALTAADIDENNPQSAEFTFTLENPNKGQNVTYIYPAAMAKNDGTVNYDALNSQDGTLATLASNFDFSSASGSWDGDNLPSLLVLDNKLAILAINLKNEAGSDITSTITRMTLKAGNNTYTVSRSATEGPIYVAIRPTSSDQIWVTATDGSTEYTKFLTGKTYVASNGYPVSWKTVIPTLDKTFDTAGMAVKVNFNYASEVYPEKENYCQFTSNGDRTYTFLSSDGYIGRDDYYAKALVVEGGKLVFKLNDDESIDCDWHRSGFSVTFDTSNNTYSEWVGEMAADSYHPSFISVEVNGKEIIKVVGGDEGD